MYTESQVRHLLSNDHQPPDKNKTSSLFTKYEELLSKKRQDMLSSEPEKLQTQNSSQELKSRKTLTPITKLCIESLLFWECTHKHSVFDQGFLARMFSS